MQSQRVAATTTTPHRHGTDELNRKWTEKLANKLPKWWNVNAKCETNLRQNEINCY